MNLSHPADLNTLLIEKTRGGAGRSYTLNPDCTAGGNKEGSHLKKYNETQVSKNHYDILLGAAEKHPPTVQQSETNQLIMDRKPSANQETLDNDSQYSYDQIPPITRRPLLRGRQRKRAIAVDDGESDLAFKTPIRPIMQRERILSEIDPVSPRNTTSRNIYSPIVRFLTPTKENVKRDGSGDVLMSPEQGVFGFGSIELLSGEEDEDIFSPYVYMILRPHVKEFLQAMAKNYEMFVYTCAKKEYAEKIWTSWTRRENCSDDCACVLGHYIKDLGVLGRDLAKTVVLDNAPHTYPYHLMNTIPIKSWSGKSEDRELQKLVPYMEKMSAAEDFREVLKKRKDHFHRLLSED
ncbi:hypothetical protein F7725_027828 [Dissostichus mawsoni]|uniref:Mitochondrial import inner membrane translocase subunit TIM50 n=1 Tax=Dissostichus mawsoni TaxID=36200 RepID=A0A7J5XE99_DISMA|nr:hypothetical protein F7725_027828 [Dissostichus mawsoni]